MLEIKELLKNNNLKTQKYKKIGKVIEIEDNNKKRIIKKSNSDIYSYLKSRNFNYFPNYIIDNDYIIMDYIEEVETPKEQKAIDLIKLVSLLHNKTTFYKETNEDDYKRIFENINNKIDYTYNYYNNLINEIDLKIYMSPSEYLLARGISKIFNSLEYSKKELEEWFSLVKEEKKERFSVVHNNLKIDHLLKNNNSYLISWDKSKIDSPIIDLYEFYKNEALNIDFNSLIKIYEKEYPLHLLEKKLLFILISIPNIIEFNNEEYKMCIKISNLLDYLYKTDILISANDFKDTK